ncbi:MAG: amidase [Methanomicrobiales archaeon]|nr:amidase [Methanomicrobiales archaeon]MDI6875791.1 amidase [Methanomicrobiales archaeon]
MNLGEYSRCDGVALADLVKRGEVSQKELACLFAEAVAKVNPRINAVIEVYHDRIDGLHDGAISAGAFSGVPFLMKDIGAGEGGRHQECGSRLMQGHIVDSDAFLTERFKEAGLTLLGRTATPEFALGISTESALVGETHNPWSLEAMAGGSSGGSAAGVAAGIVPVAHGSDNGGSIRIPASACGLVGLKPSRGRVTLGPDIGELWPGMLQEFVLSRTVRDTARMLDTVSAPAPGDPFVIAQPARPYAQEVNAPVPPLRIAWTADSWQPGTTVDPEVVGCVEQAVSVCEAAGHELVEASPVFDYETYLHAVCVAWAFGMYAGMDMFAAMTGRPISEDTLEPVMLSYYEYSRGLTGADMFMAEFVLNSFRRTFGKFLERYDMLLTPTLIQLPERLGRYTKMRTDIGYVDYMRLCDETRVHTVAANVTGQPAITLPLGQSRSGLPIGVQFMARFGEEGALIRLASSIEQAMPWSDRLPPVHASR